MATAKITLIGFNNYMKSRGDDLFSKLTLPTGIDRDTVINNILLQGGEFEVLYSDPYFFQDVIEIWSKKWERTFQKWYEALQLEYEPLYNYDRYEESEDQSAEGEKIKEDEKTSRKEMAVANDHSTSSGSGSTENTRSAFDSSTYQPHDKATNSSTGSNISDSLTSASGDTTRGNDIERNKAANNSHKAHLYGNIGVTTSMQLLTEQLELVEWNLYEHITDLFLKEFCIWIY